MQKEYSSMVIRDEENDHVLLILRRDFRIWALPGGGLEIGETPEDAAVREVFEETGYEVKIDKFIGRYQRPQFHDLRYVYRGRTIGGYPLEAGPETAAVKWFPVGQLPKRLAPSVLEIILDAFSEDERPMEKTLYLSWWQVKSLKIMVKVRDLLNRLFA